MQLQMLLSIFTHLRLRDRPLARRLPIYLLSIPGMRESIKEGMAEPLGESAKELEW